MQTNKIKILPPNLANKIAAGEVVQRPASVVKELLENSIDAGAKNIEVFIKRAGKSLIQVVDDGFGMSEEDAVLCIQRHATSKISDYKDLEAIKTFGFRGEALSSIAAVSLFELKTKRKEDELGTLLKNDESSQIYKEKGSFPEGTSISVKNLFFNTPARRNFMKTNATELKHIIETFKKSALPHPGISFKLFIEDELEFDFPAGTIEDRMMQIFADNIFDAVVEVKEITDFIGLTGYIAKPTYLKKSKGEQYLYINKRYVVNKSVNHAVFSAYEHLLEKGDYPFFVLFLSLDPSRIDVNIHPSKLEVKFEDEKDIYVFVNSVIKKSIGLFDLTPNMSFDTGTKDRERLKFENQRVAKNDFDDRPAFIDRAPKPRRERRESIFSEEEIDMLFGSMDKEIKSAAPEGKVEHPFEQSGGKEIFHEPHKSPETEGKPESPFLVSLHNKYILTQIKSGLMIIDQHVAHERILYEKALKSLETNLPFAQQLLFSQTIQLDKADFQLVKEIEPYLTRLGFELKFFGKNTLVIDGVPPDVKVGTEVKTLLDILDEYRKNQREKKLETRDNLAASFACKAAIKAGDRLSQEEMRLLVDQLFATSMPYVCPHGRPIVIKIPLEEFDKRFGRT